MNSDKHGVTIITGAAGGMGSATAARFAALGRALILCDMSAERLAQVAATLRATAQSIELLAGDIADPKFPATLLELLNDRPIDAIVHSAGLSPTMGDAAKILAVNYDATARLVDFVRPRMSEGACAVLIASTSGYAVASPENDALLDAHLAGGDSASLLKFVSSPGHAYSFSKRGVQLLVEHQAMSFGERNTRIMSISPGLIDTSMGRAEAAVHPIVQKMRDNTPLARYGLAEEIASVAVFLCSSDASFVTGSDIKVDGGVLAAMRGLK